MCMGFWVGVTMMPFLYFEEGYNIKTILLPFSASAVCWVADGLINIIHSLNRVLDKIEEKLNDFSFLKF